MAVAAAACLATMTEARRTWQPARETAAALSIFDDVGDAFAIQQPQLALQAAGAAEPPATTAAPAAFADRLRKRHSTDNTCGYISGIESLSLYCSVVNECVANSYNSFVGCCPDTSTTCPIPTTCYASSEGSLYTTSNGYTLWW